MGKELEDLEEGEKVTENGRREGGILKPESKLGMDERRVEAKRGSVKETRTKTATESAASIHAPTSACGLREMEVDEHECRLSRLSRLSLSADRRTFTRCALAVQSITGDKAVLEIDEYKNTGQQPMALSTVTQFSYKSDTTQHCHFMCVLCLCMFLFLFLATKT
ncbi:hypothetical protein CHS0354_004571 [Potamilus streckersoni]|uniref:Uncharacterized protein n=1 Tax=Potamilus streckersoni TaxID=2493646 RepID=A0AAE0S5Q3_9BIVA|nr:hypothetical protein CHS0354_004571 [Potamilus streckersoni]